MTRNFALGLVFSFCCLNSLRAQERPLPPKPAAPQIEKASDEAERALGSFKIPEGVVGNVFAAEPDVANPVAFYVDGQGNVFVCETFRQGKGVEDNRSHAAWLLDDLAAQSVEDRFKYLEKHLQQELPTYTENDDRIRLLLDKDQDGRADESHVFSDRYNEAVAGTGAGVLSYGGKVYYTCIPDLWMLEDTNGDAQADVRKSLHTGYGVRFAFRGHDMHGLTLGPDGRLYWSIGDRGYNVTTENTTIKDPSSGAIFRCELDGSNLEVFATGLRNPQELAFDDFGNLFTGDNNSDSGDQARWVYVVQDGDTGWRMYYQYLDDRGPFNREKIWHPYHEETAAYTVPPVTNISDGPSGLAYYPGTGFSDDFKGRFFLCDFRGQASNSGIRSFRVKPNGATFELVDQDQPFWNILPTDMDFAPDGSIYIADWVHGWNGLNKGRIYRFVDSEHGNSPIVKEVKQILSAGLTAETIEQCIKLLGHADKRVRQEAQFELARRNALEPLSEVAKNSDHQLARIHGIWGLWQLARTESHQKLALERLVLLLHDDDVEIQAQAARVIADLGHSTAHEDLVRLVSSDNARVQFFATKALGSARDGQAFEPIVEMLRQNNDHDPMLRHAGIVALSKLAPTSRLVELKTHESKSVRLAAVVALRRQGKAEVARFLDDSVESIVLEAARAIHDLPIEAALPELANQIDRGNSNDALVRRILNACFRVGGLENAKSLARFAADSENADSLRIEALKMLADWHQPNELDRVLGDYRPLPTRDQSHAKLALEQVIASLLAAEQGVALEAAQVASKFGIKQVAPLLAQLVADVELSGKVRSDALRALENVGNGELKVSVKLALDSEDANLRSAGLDIYSRISPEAAIPFLGKALDQGETAERQQAIQTLAMLDNQMAEGMIQQTMERLLTGKVPADMTLELLEVARFKKDSAEIQELLKAYEQKRNQSDDPLAQYAECLEGGDAQAGLKVFKDRSASCYRCHIAAGEGGNVGPDLSTIGKEKTREYLLEAVVLPNKAIAKGFETVIVLTIDGIVVSGIKNFEDDDVLKLMRPDGEIVEIPQDDIEQMRTGESSMPSDITKVLSKRQIRDVVEFLTQQTEVKKLEGHQ